MSRPAAASEASSCAAACAASAATAVGEAASSSATPPATATAATATAAAATATTVAPAGTSSSSASVPLPRLGVVTPTSAKNDPRAYRVITLDNGMQCALVSDPFSERAAASLDVGVGSFSDPDSLAGLTNLCSSVMFGDSDSSVAPLAANSFGSYVSALGGSCSALVEEEHSRLEFDIDHAHLGDAMARFSQAIRIPRFAQADIDCTVDELEAAHHLRLESDEWRSRQLLRATANPKHPFSRFDEGSRATLRDKPQAAGVDVRSELIKFHLAHYTSDRMSLAVSGRESLDQLEKMVRDAFDAIPAATAESTKVALPVIGSDAFTSAQLGRFVQIVPVEADTRVLQLIWCLDSVVGLVCEKALDNLTSRLTTEHAGTYGLPRRWIDDRGVSSLFTSRFSLLFIDIWLKSEGLDHVDEIAETVMSYVKYELIPGCEQEANNKQAQEKCRRHRSELEFAFYALAWEQSRLTSSELCQKMVNACSLPLVCRLSRGLHVYPPEHVVTEEHDESQESVLDIVARLARMMAETNRMRVHLTSPRVKGDAAGADKPLSKDRWSGVEYLDEPMPASLLACLTSPRQVFPDDKYLDGRPRATTSWRELIGKALVENSETWSDVEYCTLDDDDDMYNALDARFRTGKGAEGIESFTLWTATRVYSDDRVKGEYFVTSVSRHPPLNKNKTAAIASSGC